MGFATPAHPDGPLPLWHTATCDGGCRPRRTIPFESEQDRDQWADGHEGGPGHRVTRGVLRARDPKGRFAG